MNQNPSVLIVEDQQLLRLGLRISLEQSNAVSIVGEADDGRLAVQEALRLNPQVILMDIGLPGLDGIEATRKIKSELPHTRVIIFTSKVDADLVSGAFRAGADGYCIKEAPVAQIVSAINCALQNRIFLDPVLAGAVLDEQKMSTSLAVKLSDSEIEILTLISEHNSNDEIASRLNVSPENVAALIRGAINKFGLKKNPISNPEQKERVQLSEWLTAFVQNLDKDDVFDEKYLIRSLIGTGGIGAVFKADHLYIDRTVAIKMLHPDLVEDRTLMRTFQREGKAAASFQHKNVVGIYDFEISDQHQPYLVMEYIEGQDLGEIISGGGRLELGRALGLFIQMCDALVAAHEHGIIHCDLKPSNILVTKDGDDELVKLVDFGLVQILPNNSNSLRNTDRYSVSGTPTYMSPEQCLGKSLDERSDIYSLGCVMFEVLTGRSVFCANTALEVFSHHLQSKAPKLSAVCPHVDYGENLDSLVASSLEKDPSRRPKSVHEIRSRLISAFLALKGHSAEIMVSDGVR